MYLELVSIPLVYREIYSFSIGESGLVYITQILGSFGGFALEFYCSRLYQRHVAKRGSEARLFTACELSFRINSLARAHPKKSPDRTVFGALFFPVGCWIYGMTASPAVHFVVPAIGLAFLCKRFQQFFPISLSNAETDPSLL